MNLLPRVESVLTWDESKLRPLWVEGRIMGWPTHAVAEALGRLPLFRVDRHSVRLSPQVAGYDRMTAVFDEATDALVECGLVPKKRKERYPLLRRFAELPLAAVDRGLVPVIGLRSFGIHVNGYVQSGDGLKLWVGKRARDKATAPGKLDHLIAGGQPLGLSLADNLIKEAWEEAGMKAELARRAKPVGLVSYKTFFTDGQRDDVLFCYDIEVPADWQPAPQDDEVEHFELWPIERVIERLQRTDDFKFNVGLVIVDFLMRHGLLAPSAVGYERIARLLRSGGD
jgi:8-oxo-dGTP pyrophosphatase MutT (NUDIX family)